MPKKKEAQGAELEHFIIWITNYHFKKFAILLYGHCLNHFFLHFFFSISFEINSYHCFRLCVIIQNEIFDSKILDFTKILIFFISLEE
jgi:hypothetical protein